MSDKIEEVRARHIAVMQEKAHKRYEDRNGAEAHSDRATLLAEVDRLRAEMLHLAEWCEMEVPLTHDYMAYLMRFAAFRLRKALDGKP